MRRKDSAGDSIGLDEGPYVLTVREAATALRLGLATTYNLIHEKELRSVRARRRILVTRQAVLDFLNGPVDD